MKNKSALFLCFFLFLISCKTPNDVAYFQGIDKLSPEKMTAMAQVYSATICEDDLLTITVTAWDPTVITPFNPPPYSFTTQGEVNVSSTQQLQTYLVDKEGFINFPVLGRVKAAGLTKQDFSSSLQKQIAEYVKDAMVNVQIVNFKITMMGEFARPGAITVRNDRMSILDAIGQVGDLSINANRKNILVIRNNDGVPEHGRIDLTDPALFASPYFYLKQNDVVYAEPNKAKKRNANYSSAQQYNITVFSSIISALSLITSVVIALTK